MPGSPSPGAGRGTEATGTITNDDAAPVLADLADVSAKVGEEVVVTAAATDADGDTVRYAWTRKAGQTTPALPDGTGLGAARLAFTPTRAGTYTMTVTASDGHGNHDRTTVAIRVGDGSSPQSPDPTDGGAPPLPPDPTDDTRTPQPLGSVSARRANPSACPPGTLATHPSLGFRCVGRKKFLNKVEQWSREYRDAPGFRNQWGLGAINADRAYAHLRLLEGGRCEARGRRHHRLCRHRHRYGASRLPKHRRHREVPGTERQTARSADRRDSHGNAVASVAVSDRTSHSYAHHGVAWGADIAMFAIPLGPSDDGVYRPTSLAELSRRDQQQSELVQGRLQRKESTS